MFKISSDIGLADSSSRLIYNSNNMKTTTKKTKSVLVIMMNAEKEYSENVLVKILGKEPVKRSRKSIREMLKDDTVQKTVEPIKEKSHKTVADVITERLKKMQEEEKEAVLSQPVSNKEDVGEPKEDLSEKPPSQSGLTLTAALGSGLEDISHPKTEQPTKKPESLFHGIPTRSANQGSFLNIEPAPSTALKAEQGSKAGEEKDIKSLKNLSSRKVTFRQDGKYSSSSPAEFVMSFDKIVSSRMWKRKITAWSVFKKKVKKFFNHISSKFKEVESEESSSKSEELSSFKEISKDNLTKQKRVIFSEKVQYDDDTDAEIAQPTFYKSLSATSSILSIDSSSSSSLEKDTYGVQVQHTVAGKPVLPFAYNIPKYIFDDEKFKWLYKDDPNKEIQRETQDIGGFRANDSGESSSSSSCDESLTQHLWIKEMHTSLDINNFIDRYYYFIEYKDYEAKLKSDETKIRRILEERKEIRKEQFKKAKDESVFWRYMNKKKNFLDCFQEPMESETVQEPPTTKHLQSALGDLNLKEKREQWAYRQRQSLRRPQRYRGVVPQDVSTNLLSSFRNDRLAMSQDRCFRVWDTPEAGDQVELSSAKVFLKTLKFDAEVADEVGISILDVFDRVQIALRWARTMVSSLSTFRAELLLFLCTCSIPETMRWFSRLVEAIVNRRINSRCQILGYLNILYDLEIEYIPIDIIFSHKQHPGVDFDDYLLLKHMKKRVFSTFYRALKEKYKSVPERELVEGIPEDKYKFLYNLAMFSYRSGLYNHLDYLMKILSMNVTKTPCEFGGTILRIASYTEPENEPSIMLNRSEMIQDYDKIAKDLEKKYYDKLEFSDEEMKPAGLEETESDISILQKGKKSKRKR